jgi:hypothetical protein
MFLDARRALALASAVLCVACSAQDPAPARPNGSTPIMPLQRVVRAATRSPDAGVAEVPTDGGAPADASDAGPPLVLAYDYLQPLRPPSLRKAPATRFGNMSAGQCRAELKKRGIATKRAGIPTPNVATPLRLAAPLHGVRFLAPDSKYGVLDCRLALALDELAQILAKHEVTTVFVDSMYRPKARMNGGPKLSQHSYGLAIDIMGFELTGGRRLMVKDDWHGSLTAPSCGPGSEPVQPLPEALKLRSLVCDVAQKYLFHHMLTPNYNAAHEDHLHFDVKRDSDASSVR